MELAITNELDMNSLYQQDTDVHLLSLLIPYLQNKSFLDIGAEKGTFSKFFFSHGLHGTLFEPLAKFAPELTKFAAESNCTFFPYAIDDKDGTADFYSASDLDNNPKTEFSSLHPLADDKRIVHKKMNQVTCRSLNSLLKAGDLKDRIGIIKIDTEGNDLNILKGMSEIKAEVLMCEYFMPGIYSGWTLGHPLGLIEEARKLGFEHYVVIKRFNEFEMTLVDSNAFVEQQWGNIIFINNQIFKVVKTKIDDLLLAKETEFYNKVLQTIKNLQDTCQDRLELINRLDAALKAREQFGNNLRININEGSTLASSCFETTTPDEVDINVLPKYLNRMEVFQRTQNNRNQEQLESIKKSITSIERILHSTIKQRIKFFLRPRIGNLIPHPPKLLEIPQKYTKQRNLKNAPKISIVTPSYNHGQFIERTISSVIEQKYPSLEFIVQDGGSTDNSAEIIKSYQSFLAHAESKKDKGQSNAINLGFKHATGEIMAYLNSDDILLPGTLLYVADFFNKHPKVDVIYGHRVLIDEFDNEIGRWVLPPHDNKVVAWADYIPQETLFWRRRIWEKSGGQIDESFNFAMDWDLILRFQAVGARFKRLPRFLGAFRVHTMQKTSANLQVGVEEMDKLRLRCHGRKVSDIDIKKNSRSYLIKHIFYNKLYRAGIFRY